MLKFFNPIFVNALAVAIIVLNVFYFIPSTIKLLSWQSGVTMAYAGIELIGNYLIHIFLFYACVSLVDLIGRQYRFLFFIFFAALLLLSFSFAFRIIEWVIGVLFLVYATLFYQIYNKENVGQVLMLIGFCLSFTWLVIKYKFLN